MPTRTRTPLKRACANCGASCHHSPCPRCTSGRTLTHHDADYRRNRKIILASATHCALCGKPPTPTDPLTADHIQPLTAGGTHALPNLQAAHGSCNKSHGAISKGGEPRKHADGSASVPAYLGEAPK